MPKAQLDMFATEATQGGAPVVAVPDAARVRGRLQAMLAELAAAEGRIDATRRRHMEKVVPQMSRALPDAERAAFLGRFAAAWAAAG